MNEFVTPRLRVRKASAEDVRKITQLNDTDRCSSYLNRLSATDLEVIFRDAEAAQELFAAGYTCFRYAVMPNNLASIALVEKTGGLLQEPVSETERLLLRTYHIQNTEVHNAVKTGSMGNRAAIQSL